jgi:hypothetical protein
MTDSVLLWPEALMNTILDPIGLDMSRLSCSGLRDFLMCMQVLSNITSRWWPIDGVQINTSNGGCMQPELWQKLE